MAGDLGVAKPEPAIFHHALATLDARPDTAAMVGNSLRSDIAGAQGVGLQAIWLNRQGAPLDLGIAPDAEIEGLAGLEAVLQAAEGA